VYVPEHFAAPSDAAVSEFLSARGVGDLVTLTPDGLQATFLPLLHTPAPDGGWGVLRGHVARNNPQWKSPALAPALVIMHGPDGYISPTWYASTREHGRVVPTWNYLTAHITGEFVVHDDPAWVSELVEELTAKFEDGFDPPWRVSDAPAKFIDGQLRAIVGVEVCIASVQAKYKLSQNRSAADSSGAIAGLESSGRPDDAALAAAMRAADPPS
jgi:transcriptional regulator